MAIFTSRLKNLTRLVCKLNFIIIAVMNKDLVKLKVSQHMTFLHKINEYYYSNHATYAYV